MIVQSTRSSYKTSFRQAVFMGLAPDGGLFLPADKFDLRTLIESFTPKESFQDIAEALCRVLLADDIGDNVARVVEKSFLFSPTIRPLEEHITLLELFSGPSCSFKDFGAHFLASLIEFFLIQEQKHVLILTATSGDTGSAVAQAFYNKEGIDVVILYPKNKVSPLQELQMTTIGANVHALEVDGTFDDCQRMVKAMFLDTSIPLHLSSANSINIGRLLPQSFYYIFAYSRLRKPASFCVPSGNFGNLCAATLAWNWGMDIDMLYAATNANDEVPEYLRTGVFQARPSVQTYASAMDVGNPSNFERLLALCKTAGKQMSDCIHAHAVDDEQILKTIARTYQTHHLHVCPHTAVGLYASQQFFIHEKGTHKHICNLSLADPGKFNGVIQKATGTKASLPVCLRNLRGKIQYKQQIAAHANTLKEYLLDSFN